MLKVSLLPESYRKKIRGEKQKDLIKVIALIMLSVLCGFLFIVVGTRQYVMVKLGDLQSKNSECEAAFPELQGYEQLFNELSAQKALIDSVTAKEPYAADFVVAVGNIQHPSIWLTGIATSTWFTNKTCTLDGVCPSYSELLVYIDELKAVDGVLDVQMTAFAESESDNGRVFTFTLTVTVDGSSAAFVEATAAFAETTIVDENAGAK